MSASLDNVQVVLRASISISPDVNAVNLSFALNGVYLTLSASPNTAAATALHTSTSRPVQFPDASAFEKPGKPCETPHFTKPAFLVLSKVLDFLEPAPPPLWPQATKSKEANPTKIKVFNDLIIIMISSFYIYYC
jgi:hypothetical protein